MPTQMNLPTLVAEAVLAELARNPELYRSVTPGPKGEDLTLDSIVMEADYSMTLTFSDGTTYSTPPVRGERGPKGVEGDQGPRGVGIHHTRWTATTNPEQAFGVAGHMDTYTLYGDEDELIVLGWFSVKNGEDGKDPYDYAVKAGYEGTKDEFYKAIAENATHIEQIRNLVSQIEHLFDMVENKGQEFIDQINQIIADFLAMKGAPGGFAELDENGKVPVEQIPDEVRGIIRVNTHAELPISGVPRQLYLVVQDETAEGASTLYHWAEFEYRPVTSSTTVLGLTELRELLAQLDDAKASKAELAEVADELQATKDDLTALTELVGTVSDFRELAFVAHRMHLPVEGKDEVLYIVRSDETNFGDLSIYAWTIDGYQRVSGKMQEAIDQRITALVEATDTDRELFLQRLQELADEVASTYATKDELADASQALDERIGIAESALLDHEQRLAIVEAFREVIGFAHFMHLPDTGDATKLYIIASDETFGGDLTAYRWSETLGKYTRMYGKAFTDIKERLEIAESGKVEGDTFDTYVNEVTEILNNYDERLTLLEEKDEVIEVNTRYDLPATGEHGVIYVVRHDSLSNNKATIHIWNGADYSPIVSACDTALGEVSSSASEVLATQVWNTSINDIPAGTPVMLAGHAINEQPAVVPLDLNDPEVLSKFVGIVYKTVSAGKSGVAVRGGVVRNFNTLGGNENWQNGDALYFRGNGSGVISNTIPSIDKYNKPIGYVLEAADNKGILYLVQDPVGNILGGDGGDGNGAPGKSAYEIAVEVEGFTGTKAEWLQSLVGPEGPRGKSAYESAVEGGYIGTEDEWASVVNGKDGEDGKSNYELAVEDGYTGTLSEWLETQKGEPGADGKSAYEVAVEGGFVGDVEDWLKSVDGKSAYELAIESGVFVGTLEEWLASLKGADGKSAYELAQENGFTGTLQEWLEAIVGADGKSAYEIAVDNGFTGTEQEWLETAVKGADGKSAYELAQENGFTGTLSEWLEAVKGEPGADGKDGKSAYEIAVDNGFVGTEQEWIATVVKGADGKTAYELAQEDGFTGTLAEWLESLKGPKGDDGADGGGGGSAPVVWLQGANENVLLTDLSPNTMYILDTRSGNWIDIEIPANHSDIPVGTEYHFVCAGSPVDNATIIERQ